jgi:hypothetical protein
MYPLPPAHIAIYRQANGDRTIRWTRRARAQQMWRDYADMPLIEPSEVYRVRIFNPYTDATLRTDYVTSATTYTYTSANIATDWPGSRPVLVGIGITQYSESVGYQDESVAELYWPQADNPQYGRDFNDGLTTGISTYGGSVTSTVVSGVYRLGTSSFINDAKAKLDAVPVFTNGGMEIDIVVPAGGAERGGGILLRTNSWWAGGNNGFAYEACVDGDGRIQLREGSDASSNTLTTIEQTATGYVTTGETIRLGYFVNGTTHLVYVNGELVINQTDATHTGSGYCGLHWRQGQSNTYAEIDNLLVRY